MVEARLESIFTMDTSAIKFGADLAALGMRRAMLVTDPNLAGSECSIGTT